MRGTLSIGSFLRHPFTLAIAGTVLGSAIIPWVAGRAQERASLADARVKKAIELVSTSNKVNVLANKMKTAFEEFEDHALSTSPQEYYVRCEQLRERISTLYNEFDGLAWWWPWEIYFQGRRLELISDNDSKEFEGEIVDYMKNVTETAQILDGPSDAYFKGDPSVSGKEPLMPKLNDRLHGLQQRRDLTVQRMANHFEQQHSSWIKWGKP